jgi:ribonuclease HI
MVLSITSQLHPMAVSKISPDRESDGDSTSTSLSPERVLEGDDHLPSLERSWFVYFDGLCEPKNPGGVATFGVVVKRGGKTIFQDAGLAFAKPWSSEASNNVAEYSAVIKGLEWLRENKMQSNCIVLVGDSRLVISQLQGKFKVKAIRLVELYHKAKDLMSKFEDLHLKWVDRSENSEADLLSRIAYSRYIKKEKRR